MKSDDPIVSFFQKLRLPLRTEGKNFYSFIENHLEFFKTELDTLLSNKESKTVFGEQVLETLKSERNNILEVSQAIINSLENYRSGLIGDAFSILGQSLNKIEGRLLQIDIRGQEIPHRYCRIRPDKGNLRSDLFHIPFSEITKVKAYRYSVAGYPCLYLAGSKGDVGTALSLCWFETGMPNQFYWSEFQINPIKEAINVVDFISSPFLNAINLSHLYTIALNNVSLDDFIIKAIFTYPIMAACSVVVADKKQNFCPEYVVPQMFLSWIRKNKKLRGVAYYSCTDYRGARNYDAFNVAIPPVEFSQEGHCQVLKDEFHLSFPEKINVSEILKRLQEDYEAVRRFRDRLSKEFNDYITDTLYQMRSLCNSWMEIYRSIQFGNTDEMPLKFQVIETLCLTAQNMMTSEFRALTLQQLSIDHMDTEASLERCKSLLEDFTKVQSSIQNLRTFDLKYFPVPEVQDFKCIEEKGAKQC